MDTWTSRLKASIASRHVESSGEAKIYAPPSYHEKGLKRASIDRYSTGREIRGLLLNYVRKEDIAEVIENLRESLDKSLPQKQKEADARSHAQVVIPSSGHTATPAEKTWRLIM